MAAGSGGLRPWLRFLEESLHADRCKEGALDLSAPEHSAGHTAGHVGREGRSRWRVEKVAAGTSPRQGRLTASRPSRPLPIALAASVLVLQAAVVDPYSCSSSEAVTSFI
ncbi:hypothetical protein VPH35_081886 [Triticum aestivum]